MKTMPATQIAGIFIVALVRGDSRDQALLFPVLLDELVPADHLCRVIDAFVGSLDIVQLGFNRAEPAATGRPAYDPADLLKLYLYGYLQQVGSSRRMERECQRNVALIWLLNRLAPDRQDNRRVPPPRGRGAARRGGGVRALVPRPRVDPR